MRVMIRFLVIFQTGVVSGTPGIAMPALCMAISTVYIVHFSSPALSLVYM